MNALTLPFSPTGIFEELPQGWVRAHVTYTHRDGSPGSYYEILDLREDLKTGNSTEPFDLRKTPRDRYRNESMREIAAKCFKLFLVLPIYLALYIAFQAIRTPLSFLHTTATSFAALIKERSWQHLKEFLTGGIVCLVRGIKAIVLAPFFILAMQFAAAYGLFKPLEGRALFGAIEAKFHGKEKIQDIHYIPKEQSCVPTFESFYQKDYPYTFFLAFCMQPGKTTDPHVTDVAIVS